MHHNDMLARKDVVRGNPGRCGDFPHHLSLHVRPSLATEDAREAALQEHKQNYGARGGDLRHCAAGGGDDLLQGGWAEKK